MDFSKKPEELSEILTFAGLEVDGIEDRAKDLNRVVVGEIVHLEKHPQADKLTLCQVNVGKLENFQIVCGAKNHKQKDKVVVALPQAVLPGNFKIKVSKIRGIESSGMLCSETELGLSSKSDGILILPQEAPVGEDYSKYAGLDDIIFDIYITTNRGDCMGHLGIAKELSCLLDRPMKIPDFKLQTSDKFTQSSIRVDLKNKKSCLRYSGRSMRGVKIKKSPSWLVQRLNSVGINSINNIVDATNFVMLECGQPLHAFDQKTLAGKTIIIDSAQEQEKFTTLDGTEIKLNSNQLTIRDSKKPVALAGVVGGLNSGVTEDTEDLFVESAYFTPESVRKTSRDVSIDTESSIRFAKGCDPETLPWALDRVCALIQEIAGGEIASDKYDEYPQPLKAKSILLRYSILEQRLGYAVSKEHVRQMIEKIGCEILENSLEHLKLKLPLFRSDLQFEIDIIEEYARLNGYDKIPETLPDFCDAPSDHNFKYTTQRALERQFVRQGFSQAVNYHFFGELEHREWLKNLKNFNEVGLEESAEVVKIRNPLSEELSVMRSSLFPGLFKNLLHNYRYGQNHGKLFEIGSVFFKNKDQSKDQDIFFEPNRAAAILWGEELGLWKKTSAAPAIFYMKSYFQNICDSLHLKVDFRQKEPCPSFLHPGQSVTLFFRGELIGYMGSLHPLLKEEFKIKEDVAVIELDCDSLMKAYPQKSKLTSLFKYPMVQRDVAFILSNDLAAGDIVKYIQKVAPQSLQGIEVFDSYTGKPLKENERSVTFRVLYQDSEKTLTEQELISLQEKLIAGVCKKFSVTLR